MVFAAQVILLLLSFVLLFIFREARLSSLIPQAIGLLVFIFIILSVGKKRKFSLGGPAGVFLLNTVIFLVIFSTGGLASGFYFVLYFVVFAIAFLFDPALCFVFAAGALLVFLPDATASNTIEGFVKIGSLFIISPLAYFFGKMFRKEDENQDEMIKLKERSQAAADTIAADVDQVIKDEQNLKPEDVSKLNEILEEASDLRAETKE